MYEKIHEKVKRNFDVQYWKETKQKAVAHRAATNDHITHRCNLIRANNIPEGNAMPNYDDYEGKFFKDNLIWKQIKWCVSMQMAGTLVFDMENITSYRDENTELFEEELNQNIAQMNLMKQVSYALYDEYYLGNGYIKLWWDKEDVSIAHETGRPKAQYIEHSKIYLDHNIQQPDKSDMNYIIHKEKYFWKVLAHQYPEHKKAFEEKKDRDGLIEVITVQFKHLEKIESVTVTDEAQQPPKKWIVPIDDLDETDNLEEQIDISMPFNQRKEFWYEATFLPDLEIVLQKPEYVGEKCSYHIFSYFPRKDSSYDYGLCYYLMDLQDMSTILLTMGVLQAFKYQKNEKIIEEGSLKNEADYIQNGYKIGVNPITESEWRRENPNTDPVKYLELPQFPQAIPMLAGMVAESTKTISGALDTMTGSVPFAGMSGVAVAQHMTAGQVYHQEEKIRLQFKLQEIGHSLMWLIAEFKDYPHYVNHLSSENQNEMVLVNDSENSPFFYEPDRMTISCTMYQDPEMLKQVKRDMAMTAYKMGIMSGRRVLEELPFSNPDRIYEEAMQERGIMQTINYLQQNPEAMQQLQMAMQQQQMQGGQQSSGASKG